MNDPAETPKLNLAFAPLDEVSPTQDPASDMAPPKMTPDEARATAAALSRLTGAPKEIVAKPRKPRKVRAVTKASSSEVEKPAWRRRPGRPRSLRKHPLTMKTTEKHLRFLYALTDEGGLLVEGIEDGLNELALKVLEQASWRGRPLSADLIAAAEALAKKGGL